MKIYRLGILLVGAAFVTLAGCSLIAPPAATETALPSATATASPLPPTNTPEPPLVYLQLATSSQLLSTEPLIETVRQLAEQDGFEFQQGTVEDPVPGRAALIITSGEAQEAQRLLGNSSETHVVALGVTGLEPSDRLTIIGPEGLPLDRAAFMAGYIGAMLIPDHRTGMINTSETESSDWRQAFRNGQQYYCGLCRPAYPPFNDYPVFATVPSEFSQQNLLGSISDLQSEAAGAIYLPPLAVDNDYLSWLDASQLILLSARTPPSEASPLTAIIRPAPELALESIWDDLQTDNAPRSVDMPVIIDRLDPSKLNDARLRLALEVLDELNRGFIQPLVAN